MMPLSIAAMSDGRPSIDSKARALTPPAAAASVVFTATLLARYMQLYAQPVEPGLKPYLCNTIATEIRWHP